MDPLALAAEIDAELRLRGDPERAERERAYLKSTAEHHGVAVPAIRAVARDVRRRLPELGHDDLVALVEPLWDGGSAGAARSRSHGGHRGRPVDGVRRRPERGRDRPPSEI